MTDITPSFPSYRNHPQRTEVPGVNSVVQLRRETWISWSTCSRFYYCILQDGKGFERELSENSIWIKRTGFGISWDFSLNPGSTIHCCGSWISDLTSCASLSTYSRKAPEKQIDVRWPFSQDAYLRGRICLLLLSKKCFKDQLDWQVGTDSESPATRTQNPNGVPAQQVEPAY